LLEMSDGERKQYLEEVKATRWVTSEWADVSPMPGFALAVSKRRGEVMRSNGRGSETLHFWSENVSALPVSWQCFLVLQVFFVVAIYLTTRLLVCCLKT
jgi:hypothetical protein